VETEFTGLVDSEMPTRPRRLSTPSVSDGLAGFPTDPYFANKRLRDKGDKCKKMGETGEWGVTLSEMSFGSGGRQGKDG